MLPAISNLLIKKQPQVMHLLERSLDAGWREALRSFRSAKSGSGHLEEPNLAYGIWSASVRVLDNGLSSIFRGSGISAKVSGVFCHKSPRVKLSVAPVKGSSTCELGDLLFVFVFRHGTHVVRNALLIQAKLSDRWPLPVRPRSPHALDDRTAQFLLYNSWPPFDYVASRGLSGHREVSSAPHKGAQYLLISYDHPDYGPPWFTAYASIARGTCVPIPLHMELFDSLCGNSGRSFTDYATAKVGIDWDCVIWDLLKGAANQAFNLASASVANKSRGTANIINGALDPPYVMSFVANLSGEDLASRWSERSDAAPPDVPHQEDRRDDSDDPPGISTIFFDFNIYDPTP